MVVLCEYLDSRGRCGQCTPFVRLENGIGYCEADLRFRWSIELDVLRSVAVECSTLLAFRRLEQMLRLDRLPALISSLFSEEADIHMWLELRTRFIRTYR